MPYVSTTWITGDTITAVLFNKCESQYAAASDDYAPSTFTAGSTSYLYLDAAVYSPSSIIGTCLGIIPIPYWIAPNSTLRLSADMDGTAGEPGVTFFAMPSGCLQQNTGVMKSAGGGTGAGYVMKYYYKGSNYGVTYTVDPAGYFPYRRIGRLYTNVPGYDGRYVDIKVGGISCIGIFCGCGVGNGNVKNIAIQHNGTPVYATTAGTALAHCGDP